MREEKKKKASKDTKGEKKKASKDTSVDAGFGGDLT
jgi:hypothetical protein